MKRIETTRVHDNALIIVSPQLTDIAQGINEIMDYLENDLKKEIESIMDKKIEERFEILDL